MSAPVPGEALALLTAWLPANDAPERPQMQLATVDPDGGPDLRTVLLSEWSVDGFAFHTDDRSRKAAQLAAHPVVALAILWPGSTRQLVVRGTAEAADVDSSRRVYAARSPYLRQLAWLNTAEAAATSQEERVAAWQDFAAAHPPSTLSPPPSWAGYLVRPDRLTFWQSDPHGPSHRVEFRRGGDGAWSEHHLAG